jgi:hypothetical protein
VMGAHPEAFARLRRILTEITRVRRRYEPGDREYLKLTQAMNEHLDEWHTYQHLATEWDAYHWGFPDDWMMKERKRMENNKRMVKRMDGRWYESVR